MVLVLQVLRQLIEHFHEFQMDPVLLKEMPKE